jgi:hypothetical protein
MPAAARFKGDPELTESVGKEEALRDVISIVFSGCVRVA